MYVGYNPTGNIMSKTQWLVRQEGRIAYEDSGGRGPLVLCAPGMGDLRQVFRFLVPALADEGYRVVTMDVRGMGESSVAWSDYSESAIGSDLLALIDHLDAGPAILIGNSISAGAAVWAAAEHPGRVAGLILVGPFVRQVPISRFTVLLFRLALARPWGASAWANYQAKRLYPSAKPADLESYRRAVLANLREPGRMRAFQRMAATDHRAAESRMDRVRAPALVVMGTADLDFPDPRGEAELVAERLHGTAVLIEGAGHYPQAEVPEAFSQKVLGFLRSVIRVA